jgi:hypothetical protein
MRAKRTRNLASITAIATAIAVVGIAGPAAAHGHDGHGWGGHRWHHNHEFTASVFAGGAQIMHPGLNGPEAISNPDDITTLNGDIFVGFQNGVGPQGEASSTGNLDSTIVEFDSAGNEVAQWDVVGKCDGLTADPQTGELIATVNEDANSSVYLINPHSATPVHYAYNEPLPSDGGTDAISIYHGVVEISASAPGTTGTAAPQPQYPAVYEVKFNAGTQIATISPLFGDEAWARQANAGSYGFVQLGLTDPDSNEVVPYFADRFGGDFMLTSQGDQQQIYVDDAGLSWQHLSVLNLSASVDDSAWPSSPYGTLYTTDNGANQIIKVTGPFERGSEIAAVTPCDSNNAPATCPGPGYPANYLGEINPYTGAITPLTVSGPAFEPQGMLFTS